MNSFLDPAILFFVFGIAAGALRSNLEIPPAVSLPAGARETLRVKAAPLHGDRFVLQAAASAEHGLRAEAEHHFEAAATLGRLS